MASAGPVRQYQTKLIPKKEVPSGIQKESLLFLLEKAQMSHVAAHLINLSRGPHPTNNGTNTKRRNNILIGSGISVWFGD